MTHTKHSSKKTTKNKHCTKLNKNNLIIGALILILLISVFTKGFTYMPINFKNTEITGDQYIILNDARCTGQECDTTGIITSLSEVLPNMAYLELDYNSKQGKTLYEELELTTLPAIIFPALVSEQEGYEAIGQYLTETGDYLSLQIGATYNPAAEICDNGEDDNGDDLIDCEDPTCSDDWKCMPKVDEPEVELFIMSYCPYGTQMQKAILPVMETLKDQADIKIKFVDYIMHDTPEIDENLVQYCVQKGQPALFLDYLNCFLAEGKSNECLIETGVNVNVMSLCIQETDAKYQISDLYGDKETWNGGRFPQFNVHQDLNEEYGVQGSPTLIINGVKAQVSRTPSAILDAVCYGFKNPPAECNTELSTKSTNPGFGFDESSTTVDGGCEV